MASLHNIARAAGIKDAQARALFDAIVEQCNSGQRVYIHGFGSFFSTKRKGRMIYSPQIPGGQAEVPERNVLRFRASPKMKDRLNTEKPAKGKKTTK